ncbi:acyclic terpene utilization AtuA family protein [Variovorax guangxiensis]|uniref:Acyclic terpene utilization AtuA family protein n=1 Tax=Variovorax guangxiensis TaxID=1775474 RepID=A0A433MFE5_9BURK|nr:acyclic terpene utilization AtuA family protein [Variovorax guangxiensis]RUR66681.1 acyclic terpene utilization AtuA family protein [Variovorax guangxiensis]
MSGSGNIDERIVRIGGASGFWGDSSVGAPQLVASGRIDYLVFDYLAELTMSILAGARLKKPELGYATDFISVAMKAVLKDVVEQGVRVVSNAGGVNPQGCADALAALAADQGIALKIAVVSGDDVSPLLPGLRKSQPPVRELQSGAALPERVLTANVYLGAQPIRAALDAGAQVVITGRCVDSAVTLGVLMHEFEWQPDDLDLLAAGSLAGHIIECGCQATGGLHTDWDTVPDWPNIGYPIVECSADGSFVVTKPAGTGGKVTPAVVGEQMLYEIGDPAAYLLPDVVADFTQVRIEQAGEHRVRVHGARGHAPTASYKVSATYVDGFKTAAQLTIVGFDAVAKAKRTGEAILARTGALFSQHGLGPYSGTQLEVLGAESCYGPHARASQTREAVLRLAVTHPRKEALELFVREVAPAGTSWAPGTTGAGGGRASVSPSIRQYAFLLDKSLVEASVVIDGKRIDVPRPQVPSPAEVAKPTSSPARAIKTEIIASDADSIEVPLLRLAWARSGDKGDTSNIGVIARHPALLPLLSDQLTEARVADWLAHLVKGQITRYEVPGIGALNFVCEQALGGGGMASLRNDPLGKGMGQILLAMPVRVSPALLALLA